MAEPSAPMPPPGPPFMPPGPDALSVDVDDEPPQPAPPPPATIPPATAPAAIFLPGDQPGRGGAPGAGAAPHVWSGVDGACGVVMVLLLNEIVRCDPRWSPSLCADCACRQPFL